MRRQIYQHSRVAASAALFTLALLGCETPPAHDPAYLNGTASPPTATPSPESPVTPPPPGTSPSAPGASEPSPPEPTAPPLDEPATELVCVSGKEWTHGNAGSSRMKPGSDCNGCHKVQGGPIYGIAGTVYTAFNEWDDCYGVSGTSVEVTAGNFYASRTKAKTLTMPFTARVHDANGAVMEKQIPQYDLQCDTCHTEWGDQGAPGRVVIP